MWDAGKWDGGVRHIVTVKEARGYADYDAARLQVSVGQPYHEGSKLEATFAWIAKRFERTIVCVNDTLQRHNLCFENGMPDAEALIISGAQGLTWVERNGALLRILPRSEIRHWEHWRHHPSYESQLANVQRIYALQADVRAAYDKTVQETWQRRVRRAPESQTRRFDDFHRHSTNYLVEETAALIVMFLEDKAADIYPGTFNLPFALVHKYSSATLPDFFASKAITRIGFVRLRGPAGEVRA